MAARQVHKCVERGKLDSYQSQPCANGAPVKAWDAVPDRDNPNLRSRLVTTLQAIAGLSRCRVPWMMLSTTSANNRLL